MESSLRYHITSHGTRHWKSLEAGGVSPTINHNTPSYNLGIWTPRLLIAAFSMNGGRTKVAGSNSWGNSRRFSAFGYSSTQGFASKMARLYFALA